jgi:formylglycine-generating enzyme required for sulfatase activity
MKKTTLLLLFLLSFYLNTNSHEQVIEAINQQPVLPFFKNNVTPIPADSVTDNTNKVGKSNIPSNMVFIKGGTFEMGGGVFNDQNPVHTVTVSDFYMSKYLVTQTEWLDLMHHLYLARIRQPKNCPKCPVIYVNFFEVQDYIRRLNLKTGLKYRLPTEAEWEYAAGGGENNRTIWAGTSNPDSLVTYIRRVNEGPYEVDERKPNQLGLYCMNANVWQWCSDWYDSKYYKYSPQNNPQGPETGTNRVARGGSWQSKNNFLRITVRYVNHPNYFAENLGFRLVLDVE